MIGIFFFNIWWLLEEPFCWWFLKTSVVPLAIYPNSLPLVEGDHLVQALWFVVAPLAIFPDSPPLVEGKILYKPCDFVDVFFARVLVEVQFLGYKIGLKGSTYTQENTVIYRKNGAQLREFTITSFAIHVLVWGLRSLKCNYYRIGKLKLIAD